MRPGLVAVALFTLVALAHPATAGHPRTAPLLTIDAASLRELTAAGRSVVAVDVRPADAYASGRVPGARSIPLPSLTARQRELPADGIVVLYGAADLHEAVAAYRHLRAAGHGNVFVLEGGFSAWQAQGFSVER